MIIPSLKKRDLCTDWRGRIVNCDISAWNSWGRWVFFAILVVGAFLLFFGFACLSARRRRRRGQQPLRGTGWAGNTWGPAPPQGQQQYPQYPNQQSQYPNQQPQYQYQQPPPQYPGPEGYYGQQQGVELQQPPNAYYNTHPNQNQPQGKA